MNKPDVELTGNYFTKYLDGSRGKDATEELYVLIRSWEEDDLVVLRIQAEYEEPYSFVRLYADFGGGMPGQSGIGFDHHNYYYGPYDASESISRSLSFAVLQVKSKFRKHLEEEAKKRGNPAWFVDTMAEILHGHKT